MVGYGLMSATDRYHLCTPHTVQPELSRIVISHRRGFMKAFQPVFPQTHVGGGDVGGHTSLRNGRRDFRGHLRYLWPLRGFIQSVCIQYFV